MWYWNWRGGSSKPRPRAGGHKINTHPRNLITCAVLAALTVYVYASMIASYGWPHP